MKEIQEKFDYFQKLNDSKIQNLFYQAKEGYVFLCLSTVRTTWNSIENTFIKAYITYQDLNKKL